MKDGAFDLGLKPR